MRQCPCDGEDSLEEGWKSFLPHHADDRSRHVPLARARSLSLSLSQNLCHTTADGDDLPDRQEGSNETTAEGVPLFLDPFVAEASLYDDSIPEECVSRCVDSDRRTSDFNASNFDSDSDGACRHPHPAHIR